MCKIEGCSNDVRYKSQGVCQKHYFRMMRNGSYHLKPKKESRSVDSRGYILLYMPHHKLASKRGVIREHTVVAYEKYGDSLPDCELCGKPLSWGMGRSMHIDHIDNQKGNNDPSNLRPLCNGCNSNRPYREDGLKLSRTKYIEFNGESKSAKEWAADYRVHFCQTSIRRRINTGMPTETALFGQKTTHKNK